MPRALEIIDVTAVNSNVARQRYRGDMVLPTRAMRDSGSRPILVDKGPDKVIAAAVNWAPNLGSRYRTPCHCDCVMAIIRVSRCFAELIRMDDSRRSNWWGAKPIVQCWRMNNEVRK